MSKAAKKFNKLMEETYKQAYEIYIEGIREVLSKCKSLDHYVDAMGTQFFVDINDEIVHEIEWLPKTAQKFMVELAEDYYDYFKSAGIKVYRDKIVTDW